MAENDPPVLEAEEVPAEEGPKPPQWEYKTEFGINSQLREIVTKSKEFAEAELEVMRRKLDRITYGS